MSDAAEAIDELPAQPVKDLYEIGEIPPLGHVPKNMYAWAIRRERHGEPDTAMQVEVVETPVLDSHDVLVMVMAAGVNYNGVWAALGKPIIILHDPDLGHALKEVDAAAQAVAETPEQVVKVLSYAIEGAL